MTDGPNDNERTGQRIAEFLADEAVQAALAAMKEQNYRLFVGASTEEGRMQAQAQALVLEGFTTMLHGIVEHGQRERTERERRDRDALASRTI